MWEILKQWRPKEARKQKPASTAPVNFKDLNLRALEDDDDEDDEEEEDTEEAARQQEEDEEGQGGASVQGSGRTSVRSSRNLAHSVSTPLKSKRPAERTQLVIIMVGLPGRGKTFLCNKLLCYLSWLGHSTRLFNVGAYRRNQNTSDVVQSAAFFAESNTAGMEARQKALCAALDDLTAWLSGDGQIAIFDATNSTEDRRKLLVDRFHGRYQYIFIESICTDAAVLEQNYRSKMKFSPDYKGMDEAAALRDFAARIKNYEEVYEPIVDRSKHYIKLIDMVTGRGHMDINRISGYIPGKCVFFLMQVCKAGMTQRRKIWLCRHGESEYNTRGLLGGDSSLSPRGQDFARALPDLLISRLPMSQDLIPVSVWTSTLKRTIESAAHLPFPKLRWKALDEISAGIMDGLTYSQIEAQSPEEFAARQVDKLRYRYPAGESYMDVVQRLEPVIIELEREKECVLIVAHQAVLRALVGYFSSTPLKDIPNLEVPLHTLIELTPLPDGTMQVERLPCELKPVAAPPSAYQPPNPVGKKKARLPAELPFGASRSSADSRASNDLPEDARELFERKMSNIEDAADES